MFMKVIARVREIEMHDLLRDVEPEVETFVWRRKYIPVFNIVDFWALKKAATAVRYDDGTIDILKEDIDLFYSRLQKVKEESEEKGDIPVDSDVEFEMEEEEEDDVA